MGKAGCEDVFGRRGALSHIPVGGRRSEMPGRCAPTRWEAAHGVITWLLRNSTPAMGTATVRAPSAAVAASDRSRRAVAAPGKAGEKGYGPLGVLALALGTGCGRVGLREGAKQVELDITMCTKVFVKRHDRHPVIYMTGILQDYSPRGRKGQSWGVSPAWPRSLPPAS